MLAQLGVLKHFLQHTPETLHILILADINLEQCRGNGSIHLCENVYICGHTYVYIPYQPSEKF